MIGRWITIDGSGSALKVLDKIMVNDEGISKTAYVCKWESGVVRIIDPNQIQETNAPNDF